MEPAFDVEALQRHWQAAAAGEAAARADFAQQSRMVPCQI